MTTIGTKKNILMPFLNKTPSKR